MSELKEKIKEAVNKHLDTAIALSKDLAEHPELPYQEFEKRQKRYWKKPGNIQEFR